MRSDPNVYPSGKVCLSILNDEKGWRPGITIKQSACVAGMRWGAHLYMSGLTLKHGACSALPACSPVLVGIQDLLDTPNANDAAQEPAYKLFHKSKAEYDKRIKEEVRKYIPREDGSVVVV